MKKYVFGKDTLTFDSDEDAISYAEEMGVNEFKPISDTIQKPTPKVSPKVTPQVLPEESFEEVLYRKVPGSKESLEMILPRTYSDEFQDRSVTSNLFNLGKDILSFPGRIVSTGAQVAGDIAGGDRDNIAEKLYQGLTTTESSQQGLAGLPEDISRSPYTILPTGNLATGLGKIAPRAIPLLEKGASKFVEPIIRHSGEGVVIQTAENIAGDKPITENLGLAAGLGAGLGLLPGVTTLPKTKNIKSIEQNIIDPIKEKGMRAPSIKSMTDTFDEYASKIGFKSPSTDIAKLQLFPKLIEEYNKIKGTSLKVENLIPKDALKAIKTGALKGQETGFDAIDLGLATLGTLPVVVKKGAELLYNKTPSLESLVQNPLAQGLGKLFSPTARTIQAQPKTKQ